MKLTQELKRMLNALAYADAAENLTLRQKTNMLKGSSVPAAKPEIKPVPAVRPQVALYMGSELPVDVMQYVMQTCGRLKHDLTVLTLQSEDDARELLSPYQSALDETGIALRVMALSGDAPSALARTLRRLPEVAFLVCNESGYLGHGMLNGTPRNDIMPVPVVLVTANSSQAASLPATAQKSGNAHAA